MLSLFRKPLFNSGKPAEPADSHARRLAIYERELAGTVGEARANWAARKGIH